MSFLKDLDDIVGAVTAPFGEMARDFRKMVTWEEECSLCGKLIKYERQKRDNEGEIICKKCQKRG